VFARLAAGTGVSESRATVPCPLDPVSEQKYKCKELKQNIKLGA
jgi:hypothetical protein